HHAAGHAPCRTGAGGTRPRRAPRLVGGRARTDPSRAASPPVGRIQLSRHRPPEAETGLGFAVHPPAGGGGVMASDRNNRPSLDDIRTMPVGEIAKLPAEHLALLQDDADAALDAAKRLKEWLEGAIALRYAEAAATVRRAEGKDTGLARFEDGAVVVAADLPKKVDWDQSLLAA